MSKPKGLTLTFDDRVHNAKRLLKMTDLYLSHADIANLAGLTVAFVSVLAEEESSNAK
jgi:hypothetical protein